MWSALGWGLFAGSSLIIGGLIALAFRSVSACSA